MKNFPLITGLIFISAILTPAVLAKFRHTCKHDQMFGNYSAPTFKLSNFERRYRQAAKQTLRPLQIVLDTSGVNGNQREKEFINKIMGLNNLKIEAKTKFL